MILTYLRTVCSGPLGLLADVGAPALVGPELQPVVLRLVTFGRGHVS